MNPLIIRSLDESTVYLLKQLAWQKGWSLEEMARHLLIEAVSSNCPAGRRGSGGRRRTLHMKWYI